MAGKKSKADPDALTVKQRRFADEVLGGARSLTAAYEAAYDVKCDTPKARKTVSTEASRLWSHPGITLYASRFREAVEQKRARRDVGEREAVRRRLWAEADGERGSDRLAALRMLGQECGMFVEKQSIEVTDDVRVSKLSDAEVIAEIEEALEQLT